MKDFIFGVSVAINVLLIILIIVFLNTPTRIVTCNTTGECYEIDVTFGEYLFAKD